MRALVTGSAGFVGRHMAAELRRRGWTTAECDLVYGADCLQLFADDTRTYDLVVHAAASAPHRAAIDGEPHHFARNLMLDAAMFDWACRTGQRQVLYLSSSAAYPVGLQTGNTPYRLHEDDAIFDQPVSADLLAAVGAMAPLHPDASYGWVKVTGERLAAAARQLGLAVTVVRPFSGYGEDQSELFPFGAITGRVRRREDPLTIWGDGRQVRDWIHIDDVVAGALAVVESGTTDPVNLCTGDGTAIGDVAVMACQIAGYGPRLEFLTDKPAGVVFRVGDPSRLHRYYKPAVDLAEGIHRALRK